LFSYSALLAFVQVLMINIVLSGDNAVVIGMVAARVAPDNRNRVIMWGMVAAVVLRLILAVVAVDLLQVIGLTLAGGILLLWVAWRLYRDIREQSREKEGLAAISARQAGTAHAVQIAGAYVPFRRAIFQIAVADVSMSVDNVLAIAGAASEHVVVLVIGLVLSIALMGVAATYVAKLLQRYPALSYIGVLLVVYVGIEMIWDGTGDVPEILEFLRPARP
jgi:YjbE family integral membrane protein